MNNENPFGITKEELLNVAAQKIADQLSDYDELESNVNRLVRERVEELFSNKLKERIDSFLMEEMTRITTEKITPVTIWGEKAGEPTTIRQCLAERAKVFWEVKVDENGKESNWGGQPRYERLMRDVLKAEFENAVKENAEVIVAEFRKAILADSVRIVTDHINKLIPKR